MATMRQIRSRIRVAKNIQQITKAMKMVAVARLKRAQDRVQAARPFAERMREVVERLAGAVGDAAQHPLLEQRPVSTVGILIVTADRGMCGGYNSAVIRLAVELATQQEGRDVRLYVIGRKGNAFFRRRGYAVVASPAINANALSHGEAVELARDMTARFEQGEFDELQVVFTEFVTAITQRPRAVKLLPIEPVAGEEGGTPEETIFEPGPRELLGVMLPRYLTTQIYQALLESFASEHGARMTSMSSATDNAGKMISGLTLTLNRARQAAITKEISEIVGGAEALKG
ncbi:MAG: ATP synthase F1 subunit gamma [Chthonomonadales bacterium]|nr:ATP synthase F1 subunit gamma [Chthonomonadales bacterium]